MTACLVCSGNSTEGGQCGWKQLVIEEGRQITKGLGDYWKDSTVKFTVRLLLHVT